MGEMSQHPSIPWLADEMPSPDAQEEQGPLKNAAPKHELIPNIEETLRHANRVTEQVQIYKDQLAAKIIELQQATAAKVDVKMRMENISSYLKNVTRERDKYKYQLNEVFYKLNQNLDLGNPNPLAVTKMLAEKEKLIKQLDDTRNEGKVRQQREELDRLHEENANIKKEIEKNSQTIAAAEHLNQDNTKQMEELGNADQIYDNNTKLLETNRRLTADKRKLEDIYKLVSNPIGTILEKLLHKPKPPVPNPEPEANEMSEKATSLCEANLPVALKQIATEKATNENLHKVISDLQKTMPQENLRAAINNFFIQRNLLIETTNKLQQREAEIVGELDAAITSVRMAINSSPRTPNSIIGAIGMLKGLYSRIVKLQDDQHNTLQQTPN